MQKLQRPRHIDRVLVAVLVVLAGTVSLFFSATRMGVVAGDYMVSLLLTPQDSYARGTYYFDAANSSGYGLDRAATFFESALSKDVTTPYLYHQMARVAFLRGDFETARALIALELQRNAQPSPSSFYISALIDAYRGDYASSSDFYEKYLVYDPHNWAAINDYAWVLLKAGKAREAAVLTARGLEENPSSPWLLNTAAISLYEIGDIEGARMMARLAVEESQRLEARDWTRAYPGNDPLIAAEGIDSFRSSVIHNMHMIGSAAQAAGYNGSKDTHE